MKFVLFILAVCVCFVGCNPQQKGPKQVAPVEKPQDVLYVEVDGRLLPPPVDRMPIEFQIKKLLKEAAGELGIPLTVYKVTNAPRQCSDHSNFWNVKVGVEGVSDLDTLKCIANTLIKIPFVIGVGTRDFQIFKPRR